MFPLEGAHTAAALKQHASASLRRRKTGGHHPDRRLPFEHLSPKNVFLSTVHAVAFTAAPILTAATPQEVGEDDDLLDWDKLAEEMKDFKAKVLKMLARVLCCTSLKRGLEEVAYRVCSLKTATRLIKDPSKSAIRKAARCGRVVAALRMVRTAAYGNALAYLSNLLVEEGVVAIQHLYARRASGRQCLTPDSRAELRRHFRASLVNFGTAYALSTIGASLGTLFKPGWGTTIGGAMGDICGIFVS